MSTQEEYRVILEFEKGLPTDKKQEIDEALKSSVPGDIYIEITLTD